jgi:hypothetical protein
MKLPQCFDRMLHTYRLENMAKIGKVLLWDTRRVLPCERPPKHRAKTWNPWAMRELQIHIIATAVSFAVIWRTFPGFDRQTTIWFLVSFFEQTPRLAGLIHESASTYQIISVHHVLFVKFKAVLSSVNWKIYRLDSAYNFALLSNLRIHRIP